jgi:hypothetical protein
MQFGRFLSLPDEVLDLLEKLAKAREKSREAVLEEEIRRAAAESGLDLPTEGAFLELEAIEETPAIGPEGRGRGNAPSFTPHYMLKASEQLTYNLYLDAARTTIWGDNTGGSSHYGPINPPNNTNVNLTIYGRITAGQDVSAGLHTDSIVGTVNF